MRKKNHENFIAKLIMTKDIIDAAELEKHIRNVVGLSLIHISEPTRPY